MNKQILILLVTVLLYLASSQAMTGGRQHQNIAQFQHDPQFSRVVELAQKAFAEQNNGILLSKADIIKVDTQVVSGINYYITFKTPQGAAEVVVWSQPWNNHFEVTGINKNIKINQ